METCQSKNVCKSVKGSESFFVIIIQKQYCKMRLQKVISIQHWQIKTDCWNARLWQFLYACIYFIFIPLHILQGFSVIFHNRLPFDCLLVGVQAWFWTPTSSERDQGLLEWDLSCKWTSTWDQEIHFHSPCLWRISSANAQRQSNRAE